jgi:SpoVK/Ycf46/Vps4 family AAA+-type ATPase
MVQALVQSYLGRKNKEGAPGQKEINDLYDPVGNRGKGIVILLHGAPGVGKTSTAECVARSHNRPLLPITYGDLGTDPQDVEATLERLFTLAGSWQCVLLLDEADVFMSRRISSDLQRNAIVSVFLRVLEYYDGILILTTNRIGDLDEAFKSRIHIAFTIHHLKRDRRKKYGDLTSEKSGSVSRILTLMRIC